jgi:hypothetical protein
MQGVTTTTRTLYWGMMRQGIKVGLILGGIIGTIAGFAFGVQVAHGMVTTAGVYFSNAFLLALVLFLGFLGSSFGTLIGAIFGLLLGVFLGAFSLKFFKTLRNAKRYMAGANNSDNLRRRTLLV